MAVMRGRDIEEVVQILRERGAYIYHACQLKDFRSYLQLGGVPSRQVLEQSGLPYTPFDTDESDREGELWDKVFVNIQDFGVTYARFGANGGTLATPNPYGPILFIFEPDILLTADDLSITLRSAGAEGFDRHGECLPSPDRVHHLFMHVDPDDAPNDLARAYPAFSNELQQRFRWDGARSVEMNCEVRRGLFRFDRLRKVLVDEYNFSRSSLFEIVSSVLQAGRLPADVYLRSYIRELRVQQINELASLLVGRSLTLEDLAKMSSLPTVLGSWVARLRRAEMDFNFNRFARYLRHGTLLEM